MRYETPRELVARLNLRREEVIQRLLTTLILDAPYPPWNSRNKPSPNGLAFLRALYSLSFNSGWEGDDFEFVDEYELPGQTDDVAGGAPDYAVLWPGRVWIIELKTEAASHRPTQLPFYMELAHLHMPDAQIDVTYITPPLAKPAPTCDSWARYSHVMWQQVVPLIRAAWPTASSVEQGEVLDELCKAVELPNLTPTEWRLALTKSPAAPFVWKDAINEGLIAANATAHDGEQRSIAIQFPSLEDLVEYRVQLRDLIRKHPSSSVIRNVGPWVWGTATSGGAPLSAQGAASGYEIRLSRYQEPI